MSSAYWRVTTDRRTFSVGVSSPPSSVKSPGRMLELADLLGPRHRPVRLLDGGGDLAAQLRVVDEVGRRPVALGLAVPPPPPGQRVGVDRDQRGDERLPVADDEDLPDERVRAQPVFEHGGSHVLAAGRDDDLLGAAGDAEEPVVVELADVAGAEPAVGHRLGGGVRVVPVAREHDRAADEDLAVVRDADGLAGDGPPDRPDPLRGQGVHRDRGGGLGEAVALEHRYADPAEEVAEVLRSAARCRTPPPAPARPAPPAAAGRPARRTVRVAA